MTDLSGKIAVVTGASRGIGHATALELGKRGAHVIALARTIGGLEELDDAIQAVGGSATLVPIDMTDTKALQALGPSLIGRFGQIDILVSAAAYLGKLTSVAQGPLDQWTRAINTNAGAAITLIQTLHPLLQKSPASTAVFLTANEQHIGKAFWGFYGASKAALEAMVNSYAAENPEMRIFTHTPAATTTRLRHEAFPGEEIAIRQTPAEAAQKLIATLL